MFNSDFSSTITGWWVFYLALAWVTATLAGSFFVAVALGLMAVPAFLGRRRPWRLFFLLAAAALAAQPLIFFGDPRFHVPVLPFVAVLAAVFQSDLDDPLARWVGIVKGRLPD